MQAIDALRQRQSARTLTGPAPDDGALQLIFESAIRAPDHGRLRPWRFILIGPQGRDRFGALLADHLRRTRSGATEGDLQRASAKAQRAPLIIVVAAVIAPEAKIPPVEQMLSAGAAAQNILLASSALGFSAVWKTGAAAYDDQVKAAFGLQPKDAIVGFIHLGTEADRPGTPARQDWRQFVQRWPADSP